MSSFIRKIQRQMAPSVSKIDRATLAVVEGSPPRKVFYKGRGQRLGGTNKSAADLLARRARDMKWFRAIV